MRDSSVDDCFCVGGVAARTWPIRGIRRTCCSWNIVLDARSDSIDIDSALISTEYLIPLLAVKPSPSRVLWC